MNRLLYAVYEGPSVPAAPAGVGEEKEFYAVLRRMREEKPAPWYHKLTVRGGIVVLGGSAAALALSLAGVTPANFGLGADSDFDPNSIAMADGVGDLGPFASETGENSSIKHAAQAYGRVVGGSATLVAPDGQDSQSNTFEVGTRFEVDANESLQIGLLGKMVANATPGSRVTWVKGSASLVELQIDQGMLAVRYDREASDPILQVRTPSAVVRVVGTVFTVQVEEGEGSAISVLRGQVEVLDPQTNQTVAEVESGDRYDVAKGNYDTVGRFEVQSALPISKDAEGDALSARVPESWHVPGLPTDRASRTLAYVPERARGSVIEGPSIRVMGTTGGGSNHSTPAPERLPIKPQAARVENDGDDLIADLMEGAAAVRRKELLAALEACRDLYASNETRYLAATCIGKFLTKYDDHPLAAEAYLLRGMLRMDYALDYKTAEVDLETYLRRAPNGRQIEKARYRLWLAATEDGRINVALKRARTYLSKYPNGRFVGKIIQRFPELKSSL